MSSAIGEERLTELFDVSLTPTEGAGVKTIAEREGVSRSRVLRVAVQRLLEEEQPAKPKKKRSKK